MRTLIEHIGSPIHTMSNDIVQIINQKCPFKSPYNRSESGTWYSGDKDWDNTPDGCIRVSDHWNFTSNNNLVGRPKIHCKMKGVISNSWSVGQFSAKKSIYVLLFQSPKIHKIHTSINIDVTPLTYRLINFKIKKLLKNNPDGIPAIVIERDEEYGGTCEDEYYDTTNGTILVAGAIRLCLYRHWSNSGPLGVYTPDNQRYLGSLKFGKFYPEIIL